MGWEWDRALPRDLQPVLNASIILVDAEATYRRSWLQSILMAVISQTVQ